MIFKNFSFIKPYSYFSLKTYNLNNLLITLNFIIFLFLIFFLFISIILHRKYIKNKKFNFKKNFFFEIVLIIFILIINFLIFFYTTYLIINFKIKKKYNFTIKIVSYQWKWYFNYIILNKNINYFSNISTSIFEIINKIKKNKNYILKVDNKLILPKNKNIRLILSSNDVIHSIFIPFINFKQDLIPFILKDKIIFLNKIGTYYGYCTELCGKNHSYMPLILKVLKFNLFKKWILSKFIEKFLNFNF